ncbi:hypothetical protein G4B88_027485 [Cannabis sativa]|uniref:EXS domain-containing protein n=1 Tax=Cannabis sativa TaxID=3483 RepID=A0A7J6E0G1_CANSA|nr:hypothetical protein G4B88_027485 [Cannabis sativa]
MKHIITLLRHMESTACYFLAGSLRKHQFETCHSGRLFSELAYVISFFPYYWRAMQLYWDFVKNWGLLNRKSRNTWLRDDLILKNKSTYYVSMGLNVVLRVAWVEIVMGFQIGAVESRLVDFLLASLEVIRRGHWNFYRYYFLCFSLFSWTLFIES